MVHRMSIYDALNQAIHSKKHKFDRILELLTLTGWVTVERKIYINFDLENIPLEIKTDSADGSGEKVRVGLRGNKGKTDTAGNVVFWFTSPPNYWIGHCTNSSGTNFPANLPSETSKIWRITLSRTSENKRVMIHCNEIEVLNFEISDMTCTESSWSNYWSKRVKKIYFHQEDTASDQYRSGKGPLTKMKKDDGLLFQKVILTLHESATIGQCHTRI